MYPVNNWANTSMQL